MSRCYNRTYLLGHVTRDAELKYMPDGTAVASFGIAINESWKDKTTGQKQEKVDYFDCDFYGSGGENTSPYILKGKQVFIEAFLHQNRWKDKTTGEKKSRVRVRVRTLILTSGDDWNKGRDDSPS